MSTEVFDKGFFDFEYPIWTLHDHKRAKPKSVSFVGIVLPHHGEVCPFFTEVGLAQRLLEITKTLNAAPLSVRDASQAANVGKVWLGRRVKYAGIDLSIIPKAGGVHRQGGTVVDLARLVNYLRTGREN